MNLIQKVNNSNGYLRIFAEDWQEMKEKIREANSSGELELIELPFNWGYLRYVYLKNHECSELVTVMFKIPIDLIPVDKLWSKWGKRRRKQLGEFIVAWIIKNRISQSKIKNVHVKYAFSYAIVSVPKFLKHRLFSILDAFKIVYKEVSPNYIHYSCPECDTKFRQRETMAINQVSCPSCGTRITS